MTAIDADPPTLVHGAPGEQCTQCGASLAADQRYCLNCGTRRAERRVPLEATGATPTLPAGSAEPTTVVGSGDGLDAAQRLGEPGASPRCSWSHIGVGVIIGNLGGDEAPVAARPPVVTIAGGALGGPTGAASPVADTAPAADEWPDRDGFTVQLGDLPKAGTDQAAADAAKAVATSKGAAAVGVLDAGAHGLTPGQLVLYSGVFETRKQAAAALEDVEAAYPAARVIEVQATGLVREVEGRRLVLRRRGRQHAVHAHAGLQARAQGGREPRSRGVSKAEQEAAEDDRAPRKAPAEGPRRARQRQRRGDDRMSTLDRLAARLRPGRPSRPSLRRLTARSRAHPEPAALPADGGQAVSSDRLAARHDELQRELAGLQFDVGGLTYEMAICDHFRLDGLVRQAARLQEVDAQLRTAEHLLALERNGAAGACPSCGTLYARGSLFCSSCGTHLVRTDVVPG